MESSGLAPEFLATLGAFTISVCDERREDGCPWRRVYRGGNRSAGPNWENERMNRKIQIGFTQRMQLKWLDRTAGLLSAGSPTAEIKVALNDLLKDQLSINGTAERGRQE